MTAHATVESTVRSLRKGADEYFIKPFDVGKLKRKLAIYLDNPDSSSVQVQSTN